MQTPPTDTEQTSQRPASSPTHCCHLAAPLYLGSARLLSPPSIFNLSQKNLRGLILLLRQSALLAWLPNPYAGSASSLKVDISTAEQFSQSDMKYSPRCVTEEKKVWSWSQAASV